jgi:hypothetical protein
LSSPFQPHANFISLQTTGSSRDKIIDNPKVSIEFQKRNGDGWKVVQTVQVDPSDPSQIERIARKSPRKSPAMYVFDTDMHMLTPQTCFEHVTANGTNTIRLLSKEDLDNYNIKHPFSENASDLLFESEADLFDAEGSCEGSSEGEEGARKRVSRPNPKRR